MLESTNLHVSGYKGYDTKVYQFQIMRTQKYKPRKGREDHCHFTQHYDGQDVRWYQFKNDQRIQLMKWHSEV